MQYVAALPIVLSAFIELSQSAVQCPAKLRQSEGIAAFIAHDSLITRIPRNA